MTIAAISEDRAGAASSPAVAAPPAGPGLPRLVLYGSGEAATSLVLNGLYGFALIFYTEALGLSPALAGLAMSISIFWEAVTEPYMGYLSDRTRSRFGTRYPWIAVGAVAMAVSFHFLWAVPDGFRGGGTATFRTSIVACCSGRQRWAVWPPPPRRPRTRPAAAPVAYALEGAMIWAADSHELPL